METAPPHLHQVSRFVSGLSVPVSVTFLFASLELEMVICFLVVSNNFQADTCIRQT